MKGDVSQDKATHKFGIERQRLSNSVLISRHAAFVVTNHGPDMLKPMAPGLKLNHDWLVLSRIESQNGRVQPLRAQRRLVQLLRSLSIVSLPRSTN